MISDSFKQDLLSRVDIVDVVGRSVVLKKNGANLSGLCPFHSEKTPSFTVSPTKQFYHCFGCGAHGNAIGFVMAQSGLGYVDAVKDLASSVGMTVPAFTPRSPEAAARDAKRREREVDLGAVMERAMTFFRACLKRSPNAVEYLKRRGLSGAIAARFRIGYAPDDWQGLKGEFADYDDVALVETGLVISGEGKRYDRFRDRIMFPIFNDRGAVVGFGGRVLGAGEPKYLNSPETPLFEKGREIYGITHARESIRARDRVLVVEGYMDVVALAQYGVGYAVATLGTATTPYHVEKLLRLADEIVFSFDGDAAGRRAARRAAEVALSLARDNKRLRFAFLPEGDDPDSFVRAHGAEAFEARLADSPTLSEFLLAELRAGADVATPEGRARLLSDARPLVQRISAPGLRLQIVKALAALSRFEQHEAENLLGLSSQAPAFRRSAPPKIGAVQTVSPEQNLLRCVLSTPALVEEIDFDLLDAERPETRALRLIGQVLGEAGAAGDAALIERIHASEHAQTVFEAQAQLLDVQLTPEQAGHQFRQLQLALAIRRKNAEFEALNQLVAKNPTPDRIAELGERVKELALLRAQRA